jgi:hypothetical protein
VSHYRLRNSRKWYDGNQVNFRRSYYEIKLPELAHAKHGLVNCLRCDETLNLYPVLLLPFWCSSLPFAFAFVSFSYNRIRNRIIGSIQVEYPLHTNQPLPMPVTLHLHLQNENKLAHCEGQVQVPLCVCTGTPCTQRSTLQ